MHSKKCTQCGNDNDPIFTNCLFCKSALPVIDVNSLSNEELIQNAAEWIGKMGSSFSVTGKDFNQWTMRDYRLFKASEIEGYANRYLELLHVRAATNLDIHYSYERLQSQYNAKKNNILVKLGGGDRRKALLWVFPIMFILIFVFFHLQPSTKDDNELEVERLTTLENQIINDLRQKKYDDARVLLNGLNYSISWDGAGDSIPVQSWRNKKNGYLQTIRELKNK